MWHDLARAKVNLCLHVTGQRADGLHELESLVVFPDIGDQLTFTKADDLELTIDGPFSAGLSSNNLIFSAAKMIGVSGHFHLTKNLPIASGIGGGSADAAAAIRLIMQAFDLPTPDTKMLMPLGADIPVCMQNASAMMSGVGETVHPVNLPPFGIVLVNAGVQVSTAAVFSELKFKSNPPMDDLLPFSTSQELFDFLRMQRNDLETPAVETCPMIADVLAALKSDENCAVVRMSGSGGTCFGLFENAALAKKAALQLRENNRNWWVEFA